MGYTDFPLVNHHLPHETYSLFMSFLGITPCSDPPTWREITFQEPEYDDIPDLYLGCHFQSAFGHAVRVSKNLIFGYIF